MKIYTIHWKNEATGRMGSGTRLFEKGEAERLVEELNREYPNIRHEAVLAPSAGGESVDDKTLPVLTSE